MDRSHRLLFSHWVCNGCKLTQFEVFLMNCWTVLCKGCRGAMSSPDSSSTEFFWVPFPIFSGLAAFFAIFFSFVCLGRPDRGERGRGQGPSWPVKNTLLSEFRDIGKEKRVCRLCRRLSGRGAKVTASSTLVLFGRPTE